MEFFFFSEKRNRFSLEKMMGFSVFSLILATIMCANGLAILSETRFLPKIGLAPPPNFAPGAPSGPNAFSTMATSTQSSSSPAYLRISIFLQSVRMLLRWPLMIINWIFIAIIIITY